MILEQRILRSIANRKDPVFLRKQFEAMGSPAQVSRALKSLVGSGQLIKIRRGVYKKTERERSALQEAVDIFGSKEEAISNVLSFWKKSQPSDIDLSQPVTINQLRFKIPRFWSSPEKLSAQNIIAVVLSNPTEDDVSTLCRKFGVHAVWEVLKKLETLGELSEGQRLYSHQFLKKFAIADCHAV